MLVFFVIGPTIVAWLTPAGALAIAAAAGVFRWAVMAWTTEVIAIAIVQPPELYSFRERPGSYLAFLGRISPEKRPDRAIRIARRAGIPLKIAAKVDKVDKAYLTSTFGRCLASRV